MGHTGRGGGGPERAVQGPGDTEWDHLTPANCLAAPGIALGLQGDARDSGGAGGAGREAVGAPLWVLGPAWEC